MHVINDYAASAWKGSDAYAPHACNVDNFNIPPTSPLGATSLTGPPNCVMQRSKH